jgi:hypothetical protein
LGGGRDIEFKGKGKDNLFQFGNVSNYGGRGLKFQGRYNEEKRELVVELGGKGVKLI